MPPEPSVTDSERAVSDAQPAEQDGSRSSGAAFRRWLASSALRSGLVLLGAFLFLTALGQLSGIDVLGLLAELMATDAGRWLFIAVVAIALIALAVYGVGGGSE